MFQNYFLLHLYQRLINNMFSRIINSTIYNTENIMSYLTANDLKVKGINAIESALIHQPEAIISVRGKPKFVIMDMAQYHYLRECELSSALAETYADLAAGRFIEESPEEHLARIKAEINS